MEDINNPKVLEVVIRADGTVVWINTEKGCVFRARKIKEFHLDDRRKKG